MGSAHQDAPIYNQTQGIYIPGTGIVTQTYGKLVPGTFIYGATLPYLSPLEPIFLRTPLKKGPGRRAG